MEEATYILGHSQAEILRLIKQAAILRPTTERLLHSAGLRRGMRVLDLGCGAGDVSILAAEMVGKSGSVVGIDRNAQVLAVAKDRAHRGALTQVSFRQAAVDTFSDPLPFDFVIGRYVLLYQADPIAFLRAAARLAGAGGILALHEVILDRPLGCRPPAELWQQITEQILSTFRIGAPSFDAAGRLIEHFSRAGLPQPMMFSDTPVGGGDDAPHYAWLADVAQTLLPRMVEIGITTAEEVAIETLESRLKAAVVEARSQIEGPAQVCAWTRI